MVNRVPANVGTYLTQSINNINIRQFELRTLHYTSLAAVPAGRTKMAQQAEQQPERLDGVPNESMQAVPVAKVLDEREDLRKDFENNSQHSPTKVRKVDENDNNSEELSAVTTAATTLGVSSPTADESRHSLDSLHSEEASSAKEEFPLSNNQFTDKILTKSPIASMTSSIPLVLARTKASSPNTSCPSAPAGIPIEIAANNPTQNSQLEENEKTVTRDNLSSQCLVNDKENTIPASKDCTALAGQSNIDATMPTKVPTKDDHPGTPAKIQEERQVARHRNAFNADFSAFIPDHMSHDRSTQMSDDHWQKVVHLLQNWVKKPTTAAQKLFKRDNRAFAKNIINKFSLRYSEPPDGTRVVQLHRTDTKRAQKGTLVVPNSKIFDIIHTLHMAGHEKAHTMHQKLQRDYYNITYKQCEAYCKLCSICQCDNPQIAPLKGAEKPIYSAEYRDRFQVDLIDMGHNPQRNTYGIEMKWILTMKDHVSGYVMLRPIPTKSAKCVAHKLNYLFVWRFWISPNLPHRQWQGVHCPRSDQVGEELPSLCYHSNRTSTYSS